MTPAFDVRHDLRRLEAEIGAYVPEMMQATVRALNRTLTTARAEGARRLQRELPGLPIRAIKARLRIQRASGNRPRALLGFSPRRFRLTNWRATQTRRGVSLRTPWAIITPDGQRIPPQMLHHAFIRAGRRSGRNVWIRTQKERYPIAVLLAPSLAEAFGERGVGADVAAIGNARFDVVLRQEVKFRLLKRGF